MTSTLPEPKLAQPSVERLLAELTVGRWATRVTHVRHRPARAGVRVEWPEWVPAALRDRWSGAGIAGPWAHQEAAAQLLHGRESVVLSTGTASGKTLAYLMPALTDVLAPPPPKARGPLPTALYLAPTKALAADQLAGLTALRLGPEGLRPATMDGDTPYPERDWIRAHANYLLTNPDMLNRSLLPDHRRWARFLGGLRYVVVDECHTYRGVFGSHVAAVLLRLRRLARLYGADPVFALASATVADAAAGGARLIGSPVRAVTEDTAPCGAAAFALWDPPAAAHGGEDGVPVRRSALVEASDLLADLVVGGAQVLAFVRSRRGAETVALLTRDLLAEVDPSLRAQVASYRGGYLPEERRALEQSLRAGELRGLATTNALELGIDVSGMDAVVLAGYPGTRASMWQQAGRAGRCGTASLAVLIARDDPLDTYLVHHPEALFDAPVEATVLDPDNPYVLAPHLCAAAAEAPLTDADLALFGPRSPEIAQALCDDGLLRRRGTGWYWTRRDPSALPGDIRGGGAAPVRLVETGTGRVLGTVDASSAQTQAHSGAVHLHQGKTWVVEELDLDEGVALLRREDPSWTTTARSVVDIAVLGVEQRRQWGGTGLYLGAVRVASQVVSYLKRDLATNRVLAEVPLDLPERRLTTKAVWWVPDAEVLARSGVAEPDLAGAAHAAEHASIGLLPLFATCDRWDIGGVSTPEHPDTGGLTVFVHDGHPGGAGFAERGFEAAAAWLRATRDVIDACRCSDGCPACVQSPKCGNGNRPLDKPGAFSLLRAVLFDAPR
ncbi:MAG: DEAD/DEAH box helicase [Sporichthyaceae bacterium]